MWKKWRPARVKDEVEKRDGWQGVAVMHSDEETKKLFEGRVRRLDEYKSMDRIN